MLKTKERYYLQEVDRYRFCCTACQRSVHVELFDDYTGLVSQVIQANKKLPEKCQYCHQSEGFRLKSWSCYVKKIERSKL